MKTDADIVRKLRTLDSLLERVRNIVNEIECCDHPKAVEIADALNEQCSTLAWPSHVAHSHLEYPERWKIGPHAIRLDK